MYYYAKNAAPHIWPYRNLGKLLHKLGAITDLQYTNLAYIMNAAYTKNLNYGSTTT